MPEQSSHDRDDQRASRAAHHDTHAPALDEARPDHASLPSLPMALLGDPRLGGRGNQAARVAIIQQMQQTYGNRAVQRYLQRTASSTHASGERPGHHAASAPVQRCGGEVHAGCGCAQDAGAGMEENVAAPAPVQRAPNTPAATPAPGVTGGASATQGTTIVVGNQTLVKQVRKDGQIGAGRKGEVKLLDGSVEIPYVGPVELGLSAVGEYDKAKVWAAAGPVELKDIKIDVPPVLTQAADASAGYGEEAGAATGGAVGGVARGVVGTVLGKNAGEVAGGYAGGVWGAVAGMVTGGPVGLVKGGIAGMKAGTGLPGDKPVAGHKWRGSAKLTVPAEVGALLHGKAGIRADVNPKLAPVRVRGEMGLDATLQGKLKGEASADLAVAKNKEEKQVDLLYDSYNGGKLSFEKIDLQLEASLDIDLDVTAYVEAKIRLGYGKFRSDRDGAKPAAPGGAPGAGPAAPQGGAAAPGGQLPKCQPGGGGQGADDKDDTFGFEKAWRKDWPIAHERWQPFKVNYGVSLKMTDGVADVQAEPPKKDIVSISDIVSKVKTAKAKIEEIHRTAEAFNKAMKAGPGTAGNCVPDDSGDIKTGRGVLGKDGATKDEALKQLDRITEPGQVNGAMEELAASPCEEGIFARYKDEYKSYVGGLADGAEFDWPLTYLRRRASVGRGRRGESSWGAQVFGGAGKRTFIIKNGDDGAGQTFIPDFVNDRLIGDSKDCVKLSFSPQLHAFHQIAKPSAAAKEGKKIFEADGKTPVTKTRSFEIVVREKLPNGEPGTKIFDPLKKELDVIHAIIPNP